MVIPVADGHTQELMSVQYRSLPIDASRAIDADSRTATLAFASEHPAVQVYRGRRVREILEVTPGAMDLSQIRGAPLLVNHDEDLLVGSVRSASVDGDRRARASVKFGNSTRAKEEFADVLDGTRTGVSFGYKVNEIEELGVVDGMETIRVKSYTPFEISLVTFAADGTVGFGRSENKEQFPCKVMKQNILLDPDPPTAAAGAPPVEPPPTRSQARTIEVTIEQARKKATADEQNRIREINAIADRLNHPDVTDLVADCIDNGTTIEEFRKLVIEGPAFRARPVQTAEMGLLGMSDSEIEQFSIVRAILRRGEGRQLDGIEREASDALAKKIGRDPKGFYIPMDVAVRGFGDSKRLSKGQRQDLLGEVNSLRALTSNVHGAGGALVGTDLQGSSLIELLRNQMFVMQMGARNITGLVGDVAIPRQTGGATCYWLGQGVTVTRAQQAVDQLALTPHRLAAATAYDKQLLVQSSISVEAFVREDLTSVLALEKDRVALNGLGSAGEPAGILQQSGLSALVTYATASKPLFDKIIEHETNLATNNADRGRLGYLCTPAVRGWCKGTPKFTSTGTPIWENDTMNGYPARATNQVPTATPTIFGRWDDLIIADWDGMDVVVDPYSLVREGQIQVVIQMLTDVGIRHAKSFNYGTA